MRRKTGGRSDPYYDLIGDFDLITASFQSQYGIRLSREIKGMTWGEFRTYLSGLSPETPLGRVVSIRAENDREVLKRFTKEQHRIRNEWRGRIARGRTDGQTADTLDEIKRMFVSMAK